MYIAEGKPYSQPYSCSKRKRKDNVLQNFIIIIISSAIVCFLLLSLSLSGCNSEQRTSPIVPSPSDFKQANLLPFSVPYVFFEKNFSHMY